MQEVNKTAGFHTILGINPYEGNECEIRIPQELVNHYMVKGPASKFDEILSIPSVLASPIAIFKGLKRAEKTEGLCYCGIPEHRMHTGGSAASTPSKLPPYPEMTFLVFLNRSLTVFEWRWEKFDSKKIGYPKNWETRFEEQLWPT